MSIGITQIGAIVAYIDDLAHSWQIDVLQRTDVCGTTVGSWGDGAHVVRRQAVIARRIHHGVHVAGHPVRRAAIDGEVALTAYADVSGGVHEFGVGIVGVVGGRIGELRHYACGCGEHTILHVVGRVDRETALDAQHVVGFAAGDGSKGGAGVGVDGRVVEVDGDMRGIGVADGIAHIATDGAVVDVERGGGRVLAVGGGIHGGSTCSGLGLVVVDDAVFHIQRHILVARLHIDG